MDHRCGRLRAGVRGRPGRLQPLRHPSRGHAAAEEGDLRRVLHRRLPKGAHILGRR